MNIRAAFGFAILVFCCTFLSNASANGRSVGVSVKDAVFFGSCVDHTGSQYFLRSLVLRFLVEGQESNEDYKYFLVKRGVATIEVSFSKIAQLDFLQDKASADQYRTVELTTNTGTTDKLELLVKKNGSDAYIYGKDIDGNETRILLTDCEKLVFSSRQDSFEHDYSKGTPLK